MNPLHAFGGAPFSDAFLVSVPALFVARAAARGRRGGNKADG